MERSVGIVKVIKEASSIPFSEFYTQKYEFHLCGGSVEPSAPPKVTLGNPEQPKEAITEKE